MDAILKQKWIDALRSGEYKQGRGCLFDDGCYCCLGVLATIQGRQIDGSGYNLVDGNYYAGALGLDSATVENLVTLNDEKREPFDEIATYIEQNL